MLFIAKLNGDPVAITAGGLVPITKPLIVTVLLIYLYLLEQSEGILGSGVQKGKQTFFSVK